MAFFKVDIERHVSRVVELRQTSSLIVDAGNQQAARDAVLDTLLDDEYEKYTPGWRDDDASRIASNDEEVRRPTVTDVTKTAIPWRDPYLQAPE